MDDDRESWNKLVNLAKQSGAGRTGTDEAAVPKSFVSRMRKLRSTLWDFAKTLLWRRLSLVATIVAIVLYLVVYLLTKQDPVPSIPTPQPPIPLSS
jgi:hypothetical protein